MLGQSKTAHQAEIDAACEPIDFYRFNVEFMLRIYDEQPISPQGIWNRMEYRPLEGFVFAVTPFNFTAIAGNLPERARADGQHGRLEARRRGRLLGVLPDAAPPGGRPAAGVINFVHGPGATIGDVALASPDLAGVHFTGSTGVFNSMWKTIGGNAGNYRNYPRIVGETGGKDFIVAHPSADADALATRSSAAPSSTRARSARPRRASTSARISGRSCATRLGGPGRPSSGRRAPTSRTSWARSSTGGRSRRQREAIDEARAGEEARSRRRRHERRRGLLRRADGDRDEDPDFRLLCDELFGPVVTTTSTPTPSGRTRSSSSTARRRTR